MFASDSNSLQHFVVASVAVVAVVDVAAVAVAVAVDVIVVVVVFFVLTACGFPQTA